MSTSSGGPNIVTSNLLVYLDAANTKSYVSGSTSWRDISGNNNHFTLFNGVGYDEANGGSLTFDGVNDYAASTNILKLTTYDYIVVDIYVRVNVIAEKILFEHSTNWNSTPGGFGLAINSNGYGTSENTHHTNHTPSTGLRNYTLANTLNWNNHINIFSKISDTTGRLTYGNRNLLTLTNGTSTNSTNNEFIDAIFYLGSRAGSLLFLNGNIASLKIYGIKLTSQEILQNFNATKTRFGL